MNASFLCVHPGTYVFFRFACIHSTSCVASACPLVKGALLSLGFFFLYLVVPALVS